MGTLYRWAVILSCLLFPALSHGAVRYASPTGLNSGNCGSWANACTLQIALSGASSGDEIWIKAGTHKPTTTTDRAATFRLKSNVALYGGFTGNEDARAQRNVAENITILSGDIGTQGDPSDNSYHVVTAYEGTTGVTNSILDGVTISGGYADIGAGYSDGGGLICRYSSSLTLVNCTFSGNYAYSFAGGLYYAGTGSLSMSNCSFSGNFASNGGGLYTAAGGSLTLTNCSFSGNSATSSGGGMLINSSSAPVLNNCTFIGNSAHSGGGMHVINSSSPTLTNCIFSGNSATSFGGGMFSGNSSTPLLTNCTFSNNSAGFSGGGISNPSSSPTIRNSIFWGNSSESFGTSTVTNSIVQGGFSGAGNSSADPLLAPLGNYGGGTQTMALLPGSPAIDAGDAGVCPDTDQRGMTRPQMAGCDIGAFEFRGAALTISIDGPGSVTSQNQFGSNYTCQKNAGGTCTAVIFSEGDTVTLSPSGSNSTFDTWGADISGSANPYTTLLMDMDKQITATFTPDEAKVKIDGDATRYYALGIALNTPTQNDVTIRARNLDFGETVLFTNNHSLLLRGGFTDNGFTNVNLAEYTTISGSLSIGNGALRVDQIKIKP